MKKPTPTEIIESMRVLNMTGDDVFARIREDLNRGLVADARRHLNFIDMLLAAKGDV